MLSIIVAMAKNRVIGSEGSMPWHIKEDLQHFKKLTLGNTVVMGRNTYKDIAAKAKKYHRSEKYLTNRKNIVLSTDTNFEADGIETIHSIEDIQNLAGDVFIIGGASVYKQTIDLSETLYVTYIKKEFEGDAVFPRIKKAEWKLINVKEKKDHEHPLDYEFRKYVRF